MFDSRADLFFENPHCDHSPPGRFGVLYLLRRDIYTCLKRDPTTGCETNYQALWPGGMAILAGIDLLAKFYKGDDRRGEVGERFKDFIHQYFQPVSIDDEETIYQLRNALLHSFGLYSKSGTQIYRFTLTFAGRAPLVQQPSSNCYHIDLAVLHQRFEQAVGEYAHDLDARSPLQGNFLKMFENYGAIHIG